MIPTQEEINKAIKILQDAGIKVDGRKVYDPNILYVVRSKTVKYEKGNIIYTLRRHKHTGNQNNKKLMQELAIAQIKIDQLNWEYLPQAEKEEKK